MQASIELSVSLMTMDLRPGGKKDDRRQRSKFFPPVSGSRGESGLGGWFPFAYPVVSVSHQRECGGSASAARMTGGNQYD